MKPTHLRALLGLSLAATLTLAWLVSDDENESSAAASAPRAKLGSKPVAEPNKTFRLATATSAGSTLGGKPPLSAERPPEPTDVPDLFKGVSWYVAPPPPPPPAPVAPPAPTAPPLPFAYLGEYAEDEHRLIILSRGERVVTVVIGDVIDKTYRVEGLTGGLLSFVYLPLGTTQTLNTGVLQ